MGCSKPGSNRQEQAYRSAEGWTGGAVALREKIRIPCAVRTGGNTKELLNSEKRIIETENCHTTNSACNIYQFTGFGVPADRATGKKIEETTSVPFQVGGGRRRREHRKKKARSVRGCSL